MKNIIVFIKSDHKSLNFFSDLIQLGQGARTQDTFDNPLARPGPGYFQTIPYSDLNEEMFVVVKHKD